MRKGILLFFGQLLLFLLIIGPVYYLLAVRTLPSKWHHLFSFFDLPSVVIVFAALLILGMGNGIKDYFLSFSVLREGNADVIRIKRSLAGIRALTGMVLSWSVVGFLIGAMIMLTNLVDVSGMSRGFGAASLTIFYGFVFIFVFCLPLEMRLRLRLAELETVR